LTFKRAPSNRRVLGPTCTQPQIICDQ